jgi:hypothetical protein
LDSPTGRYAALLYLFIKLTTEQFSQESIMIDKKLKNKLTNLRPFDEDALLEADSLSDLFPHPEPAITFQNVNNHRT